MILHIPHTSTRMIDSVQVENAQKNLNLLTDWYADELFEYPGEKAHQVVFDYSRLVVDVERFKVDEMESVGKGFAYRTDIDDNPIIRDIDECEHIYDEYHRDFTNLVNQYLSLVSPVVIVDCHTFNSDPLPWEDVNLPRPDICIGVNVNNIDLRLVKDVYRYFFNHGLSVSINVPYSGSIVPSHFIDDEDVVSIMIEVNKSLYLNNEYGKSDSFEKCKDIIRGALDIIYEWKEEQQ